MDLAYLNKGINRVLFLVLTFENLYFLGMFTTAGIFFGLLNKCCISECFIVSTDSLGTRFIHQVLQ